MGSDWLTFFGVIGAAVLASLPGILALVANRQKDEADVAEKYQNIASQAADRAADMMSRVAALESDMTRLKQELQSWKDWAERLVRQIVSLGHEPVPFEGDTPSTPTEKSY